MTTDVQVLAGAPCTIAVDWDPFQRTGQAAETCGEPSLVLITLVCIHEHVDRALACAACAVDFQRMDEHGLSCSRCEDAGGAGHECVQAMTITWLCGDS